MGQDFTAMVGVAKPLAAWQIVTARNASKQHSNFEPKRTQGKPNAKRPIVQVAAEASQPKRQDNGSNYHQQREGPH